MIKNKIFIKKSFLIYRFLKKLILMKHSNLLHVFKKYIIRYGYICMYIGVKLYTLKFLGRKWYNFRK
jgi:hypothetical protein